MSIQSGMEDPNMWVSRLTNMVKRARVGVELRSSGATTLTVALSGAEAETTTTAMETAATETATETTAMETTATYTTATETAAMETAATYTTATETAATETTATYTTAMETAATETTAREKTAMETTATETTATETAASKKAATEAAATGATHPTFTDADKIVCTSTQKQRIADDVGMLCTIQDEMAVADASRVDTSSRSGKLYSTARLLSVELLSHFAQVRRVKCWLEYVYGLCG